MKDPLVQAISMIGPAIERIADVGREPGDTLMRLAFKLRFENYVACVPNGHAGVMLRADLPAIETGKYRGHGLIFGRFGTDSWATRNLPNLIPVAVLQTWANGGVPETFEPLFSQSVSPALHDGIDYSIEITTAERPGYNTLGYLIRLPDGSLLIDTGPIIDVNPVIGTDLRSIVIFNATDAGAAKCPYAIRIDAPTATWSKE